MILRGRVPGKPGLWDIGLSGDFIETVTCADPGYRETGTEWITPGLFDLQVNGIGGVNFANPGASIGDLARADELLAKRGISRYCPTIITRGGEDALAILSAFRSAREAGAIPRAWGIHLEGPYISAEDGYRGVHSRQFVRDPLWSEMESFQTSAGGMIRIVTLAPEREGAEPFIRRAVEAGIVVSIGHTNASGEQIGRAVAAGARMSTHLFNACAQLIDRHANVLYAQLAEDSLFGCFIADFRHVPREALRIALRAKGHDRSILVSDLAHLSGLPDGEYEMEGNRVELRDHGIWVKGSRMLSGAARALDEDVALLAGEDEPGIERALLLASANPAAAVGEGSWALLAPGRRGPIAVFSWDGRHLALRERIGF
jgi:N-acetylglucosamine-6-phosphate deacetylase